ncbi:Trigger factor [bioreactor metagenome]|uniref:Trigger factor n=1 Tax=bioreactor metagenome TaxID=1076179 RepID=A0A644WSB9_9ZZZZ
MNFEFEKTGDLTASLKTNIEPADYQPKVEEKLRDYRRKASMPGFRPGKVPFGVIKKMYGNSVLADEVLHLASEAVYNYLEENKVSYILSPMMDEDSARLTEWNEGNTFTFRFDVALEPEFEPAADKTLTFTKYEISHDETDVEKYLDEIRERYGKFEKADSVTEKSFVSAQMVETENGEKKEGGIEKFIHLRINTLPEHARKFFIGKKPEDSFTFDAEKDFPDADERTEIFNMTIEDARKMSGEFKVTLNSVLSITPAELNEQLYAQVFPDRHIESEDQLREIIRQDVKGTYEKEARKQFYFDVQKELKTKFDFTLPEEFLKKFIRTRSEKELTEEDIEKGYPFYADEMKWQLIENKLIKKYDLVVTRDAIRDHLKELLGLGDMDGNDPEVKAKIDQVYDIISQEKERFNNLVDNMTDERLIKLFEENCNVETKQMNWKDFLNLVNEKN